MDKKIIATAAAIAMAGCGTEAFAKNFGGPIELEDGITLDPMVDANLRYEHVSQAGVAQDADAITLRLRFGGELKVGSFGFLAEGENTIALDNRYNDTIPSNGVEPYPIVADPENLELNRLQISWKKPNFGLVVGRQRIIQDNARFVGNVGWRQNEQTFDAVRGTAKFGRFSLDAAYAISQRTIFGVDSPNGHFDGNIVLLNASFETKSIKFVTFSQLIDYDTRIAFSSQTYGMRATGGLALGGGIKLEGVASFATQSDYGRNPVNYRAEYYNLEASLSTAAWAFKGGYEELGSDKGKAAFQTPLATLHAFNGWADLFLTTPSAGLRDYYVGASYKFVRAKALPGLNLTATWHRFDSDRGAMHFGDEFDASLGFKLGAVALLAKYAHYDADKFGANTEKVWLQASFGF